MNVPQEDELLTTLRSFIEFYDTDNDDDMCIYYKRHAFINFQNILSGSFDRIQFHDRKIHRNLKKQAQIDSWKWKVYWRKLVDPCHIKRASVSLKKVKNQRRRGIG